MAFFETVAEYTAEIAYISNAITDILISGASYTISIAGNSRTFTKANIKDLIQYKALLVDEKQDIDTTDPDSSGLCYGAGF